MQNIQKQRDQFKAFAPTASFQMLVSPIALGISALDLHGLSDADRAIQCRRAAQTLLEIADRLEARS
jgi:hypothetical protein